MLGLRHVGADRVNAAPWPHRRGAGARHQRQPRAGLRHAGARPQRVRRARGHGAARDRRVEVHVRRRGRRACRPTPRNLVVRAIATRIRRGRACPLPGLRLRAHNVIPHGRGMGSSGAAVVSGIVAAKGLLEGVVDFGDDDPAAPGDRAGGPPRQRRPRAVRRAHDRVGRRRRPPAQEASRAPRRVAARVRARSTRCRRRSPAACSRCSVPHEDAVFNVSRSALLIAALTQSPELLFAATEDRLHQNYRAEAMPETAALVQALRAAGYAAVVSGAGPSILVLADGPGAPPRGRGSRRQRVRHAVGGAHARRRLQGCYSEGVTAGPRECA